MHKFIRDGKGYAKVVSPEGDIVTNGIDTHCVEYCIQENICVEGRCHSCKFWYEYRCYNRDSIEYDISFAFGEFPSKYEFNSNFKLVYWDERQWSASHRCGPFFGCVNWIAKK